MRTHELGSQARSTARGGVGFALLTLLTHVANFGFVAVAGRLLPPGEFAALVALLGIVLLGLAPGMAVQALTAAGVVGRPVLVDRELGRRLGFAISLAVAAATFAAWVLLAIDGWVALLAVPVAAGLLPRNAVNEGLLQGHNRFLALGAVMAAGAVAKFASGTLALAVIGDLDTAVLAVLIGYAVQLGASRSATRELEPRRDTRRGRREISHAIAALGALLLVVHVDAILAPALLGDVAAGRYGVGVTAARVTFWLPQFAILLWFPRMVRARSSRELTRAVGAVLGLAGAGAVAAVLLGPWAAELVFGPVLGAVGGELWRWVWLGAAGLLLQVLTLADLALGNPRPWRAPLAGLVLAGVALPLAGPDTAAAAATVAATALSATAAAGTLLVLRSARR